MAGSTAIEKNHHTFKPTFQITCFLYKYLPPKTNNLKYIRSRIHDSFVIITSQTKLIEAIEHNFIARMLRKNTYYYLEPSF